MIRFKPLPFVQALHRLAIENENLAIVGKKPQVTMEEVRSAELSQTVRSNGWQIVTEILRELELKAHTNLRSGTDRHERLLGRLECLEEIRTSIASLLSVNDREHLELIAGEAQEDWFLDAGGEDD